LEIFEYILLMLAAIALSNLLNRMVPSLSVPLIQIFLGITLTWLPLEYSITLNPELFLLLFIAPLLFNDGRHADKEALWGLKKPILLLALGLVFMTVAVVGYFVHWLIPVIPLAAAFALAAALAPTDAVAVGSLEDKVKIPHQTMKILEGESLINDASGLVSFQFAVAAMVTGAFSLKSAGLSFIGISLGGVALGLLLTLIKYGLVNRLRKLGLENVTLHMLLEVLTPFAIFLAAEELGVNGILAVVSSGIAHSIGYKKLNPEVAKLNIVSKSTWSVLIFVLNGLVFLLLGTQLPEIIRTIWSSSDIGHFQLIAYTLVLTAAVLTLRLIWIFWMNIFPSSEPDAPWRDKLKQALILSLAGVRGTITLAGTLSLPLLLDNGNPFPQRDLIIFLGAGVILWTLLAANYLLPVLMREESEAERNEDEIEAQIELLRNVVVGLREQSTDTNGLAMGKIINTYTNRIQMLKKNENENRLERYWGVAVLKWERESTLRLLKNKEVNPYTAYRYLNRVNRILFMHTREDQYRRSLLPPVEHWQDAFGMLQQVPLTKRQRRAEVERLKLQNNEYILKQLRKTLADAGPDVEIVNSFVVRYERDQMRLKRDEFVAPSKEELDTALQELARIGLQLERDQIQLMFESGRLSRSGVKELKRNLSFMEYDLREEMG